jgi:arsenate reductase
MERKRVLFVCTGNAARSQMAEALLKKYAGDRFEAHSAGLEPEEEIHPLARRVMEEVGVCMTGQHPKSLHPFLGRVRVDLVVFVCARAERNCPFLWPGTMRGLSWPFEDPAACEGDEEERLQKFRAVRDQIEERIRGWLAEAAGPAGEEGTDDRGEAT